MIRNQSISIIELERKVKDYDSQLKIKEYNKEKLVELQDQIDILKPQAERLSQAENQIEKLRSKIEELNEVMILFSSITILTFSTITTGKATSENRNCESFGDIFLSCQP